jgi:hypothetical protein
MQRRMTTDGDKDMDDYMEAVWDEDTIGVDIGYSEQGFL